MKLNFDNLNPLKKKETQNETSGVDVMEPKNTEQVNVLSQETAKNCDDLKNDVTVEKMGKLAPEKRKIVIDKVKALLSVAMAAGITAGVANFSALENASDTIGTAGPAAIIGSVGLIITVLSAIGIGIRNIYNKEMAKEI